MMLPRSALLGCAFAVGLLVAPAAGWTQDDPTYTAAKQRAADAFKDGRYDVAAQLFKEAFDAQPHGNLLYNIGLCYEKSGDVTNAVTYYQRFIDAVPNSPKRPALVSRIAELKKSLHADYVEVSVSSRPAGATVFVDDKSKGAMGAAPVKFQLLPGTYTIIAELPGHEPANQSITLSQGRPAELDLVLVPADVIGSVLLIISEPGAQVLVDDKPVGRTPLEGPLRLRQGPHTVKVMKPGFGAVARTVEVKAGAQEALSIDLSDESSGDLAGGDVPGPGASGGGAGFWPWVVVGAGVVAVGGGAITGLSAKSLHDQLSDKEANDELIASSDIDTGNNLVLLTNVLYGVGGAAIAGGLAWWWFGSDAPVGTRGSVQAGLGVGPDGAPALQVLGTF